MKTKRLFLGTGYIEKAGVCFERFRFAGSEGQFRRLIRSQLKKEYPQLKVYPIFRAVVDITELTDAQAEKLRSALKRDPQLTTEEINELIRRLKIQPA